MRDMTVGQPRQHLWAHALPLLLGNWMQLSYNAVDSIIAGRFIGREALAAEGIAAPVMNLVILAISGVCIGAGILMSEAFGAKDRDKFSRVLANTVLSGLMVCCVIAGLGMALTPQILQKLEVPEQIHDITVTYLRITFLGAPFTFCYNALSAGLKSVGDARTPLKFLAFSSILNAVLDLIFLGLLGFGILCSAATTVFAEAVSATLAVWYMGKRTPELIPKKHQWHLDGAITKKLLLYGGPTALQQAIQPVCKVLGQCSGCHGHCGLQCRYPGGRFCLHPGAKHLLCYLYLYCPEPGCKKDRAYSFGLPAGHDAGTRLLDLHWNRSAAVSHTHRQSLRRRRRCC